MRPFLVESVILLAIGISSHSALAMDYFDQPINYWKEQVAATKPKSEVIAPIKSEPEKSKFEWKKYLDPSKRTVLDILPSPDAPASGGEN